ncbi:MAG: DUF1501 domain-containing protein [Phycisphaerales bacterium]|nr:DUF1501 domain-containing protein [Phycisphaerales bacterium]
MKTSRRVFLKSSIGGAALLAGGVSVPGFLARTARAATCETGQRILVVVQLTGGNDGLNTVVPFRDDIYARLRPTLRISDAQALRLTDDLGLHPEMRGLKKLFDHGQLSIINNVGYPNPDRSHFRSMDIWHTANLIPEDARDGWLGRVVDSESRETDAPGALHLASAALPLALRTQRQPVPSVESLEAFRLPDGATDLAGLIAAPRPSAADDLLYVQRVAVASCTNARRIESVLRNDRSDSSYPDFGLAGRLRQIAQLIGAEFGARVYYTSLDGFDTHARQALAHGPLLRELSESLAAFQADLAARGVAEQVLTMTFSEFGRRVAENGSQGTDHGAAAPMMVMGAACRAGVIGGPPKLDALVDGDVAHQIDFRSVYATVLDDWLQLKSTAILGKYHERLAICKRA